VPKTYLILNLICDKYLSDQASKDPTFTYLPVIFGEENPQCRDDHVQALVANFNLYMNLLSGIFSAIVAPQMGALSDRYGRIKVLVCVSGGAFMMEVITIIIGRHPNTVSIYWMLLGAFLDGISGSFTTGMALAFAYASDCSPPERRNVAFGYFHGTLFTGIALGPLLSGWLIRVTGTVMSAFYLALACHVFYILFIALIVPESLSKERQLLAREKRRAAKEASPHKDLASKLRNYNIFEPLWVLRPKGPGATHQLRRNLFVIAAIDTMMFGVAMGTMQIVLIYSEYRFGWNAVTASMYLSSVNVCRVLGLVVLLPTLTRIFRGPMSQQSSGHRGSDMLDIHIIRGAVVFEFLGYIGYAFTPSGAVMFISGMVASLGGIGSPTLQSSLTKAIPADRTGQILGASGLLHALARVVAPTIFNLIYMKTVGIYAGIVFICLASMFLIILVLSWFLKPGGKFYSKLSPSADDPCNSGTDIRPSISSGRCKPRTQRR
jgi:MFS family permease